MRKFLKTSGLIALGFFILIVLPGLARNRQMAKDQRLDRSPGDWQSAQAQAKRVDQLIAQQAADYGVELAPPADPLVVVRRLNLALVGSVPSLEEIRAFQALIGTDSERLQQWTDRLLVDPRCHYYLAERFARAMVSSLPVEPFFIYRRRRFVSWLSDELAANRPYDQLVRQIIAAEGLWTDHPAANYITAHEMEPARLANRTARAFLGLRMDCAECHDHPFAEWTQQDFRGLAAFFSQCGFGFQGVKDVPGQEFKYEDPATKEEHVVSPQVPFEPQPVVENLRRREQLAEWVTHYSNPYFAAAIANRMWRLLIGKGIVEPVDDLQAGEAVPGVLDSLAEDFRNHGHDLRHLIRVITATEALRRCSSIDYPATQEQEEIFAAFPLTRLRPEQVASSLVQVSSLHTMDEDRNLLVRFSALASRNDFIEIYGDAGEDELAVRQGNIPQRLLMLNGKVTQDRTKAGLLTSASSIAAFAPDDRKCVETAYLVYLCRLPSPEEVDYFRATLQGKTGETRQHAIEDMMWALVNSTEFSWVR